MIVMLFCLMFLQVFSLRAQDIEKKEPIQLPDVILQAEDTVYLYPPPAVRETEIRIVQQYSVRIPYLRAVRPTPIQAPDVKEFPESYTKSPFHEELPGLTEIEPGPGRGMTAEISYLPGILLGSTLSIETEIGRWRFLTDIQGAINDAWVDHNSPAVSFLMGEVEGQRSFNLMNLYLYGQTGVFTLQDHSAVYLISTGKELTAAGDRLEIQEKTSFIGTRQPEYSGVKTESVLGEKIEIKGLKNWIRAYGHVQGFLRGSGTEPQWEGYGLAGLGGIIMGDSLRENAPHNLPLALKAGGSMLYYDGTWKFYPEAQVDIILSPLLTLKTSAETVLKIPVNTDFLLSHAYSEPPLFKPESGFSLKSGILFDLAYDRRINAFIEYRKGNLYQVQDQKLTLMEDAEQGTLLSEISFRILPAVTAGALFRVGFSLPLQDTLWESLLTHTLMGTVKLDFIIIPLEFIIGALWGDVPVNQADPLICGNNGIYSGQMFFLKAIWTLKNHSNLSVGANISIPEYDEDLNCCFLISYEIRK